MSLKYNKKRRGPKTDPCGTPKVIFARLETAPSTTVNY